MSLTITIPAADEYPSFYAPYFKNLPQGDIIQILEDQRATIAKGVQWVANEDWSTFRYEPGKWCVADIIGHITDAERISSTRALRFSRADRTPLPGWDQDEYTFYASAEGREIEDLGHEFDLVRQSTIAMIKSWETEAFERRGVANDHEVSVRGLVYIIAAHANHHISVLRERYQVKF